METKIRCHLSSKGLATTESKSENGWKWLGSFRVESGIADDTHFVSLETLDGQFPESLRPEWFDHFSLHGRNSHIRRPQGVYHYGQARAQVILHANGELIWNARSAPTATGFHDIHTLHRRILEGTIAPETAYPLDIVASSPAQADWITIKILLDRMMRHYVSELKRQSRKLTGR